MKTNKEIAFSAETKFYKYVVPMRQCVLEALTEATAEREAEIARLNKAFEFLLRDAHAPAVNLVKAQERANALEGYAVHHASCKRAFNSEQPCTCGLDRLLKGGDVAMTPQDIDPATVGLTSPELAKAKEDSELLDWLNEYGRVAKFSDGWNAWDTLYNQGAFIRDDIRQAIRAAIAAGKGKE
jgi:hypothetical protein